MGVVMLDVHVANFCREIVLAESQYTTKGTIDHLSNPEKTNRYYEVKWLLGGKLLK